MLNKIRCLLTATLCIPFISIMLALSVFGAVPQELNYQGFLTDSVGNPVDGMVDMTFNIYNADTGGTALYTETQTGIEVINGVYHVQIGSVVPIPYNLFEGDRYLGIAVETDPEMSPRQKLTATAFSIKAQDANTLGGLPTGSYIQQGESNSISSAMILNNTITSADIGTDAVGASEISANSVGESEIEAGAVRSSEVLDNSLTAADLAPNSVGQSELANNSVGTGEIIDGAVTVADLQDGAARLEILDDDGPGSDLNADYLDNLDSSAFMPAGTDVWVNTTGDSMSGKLNISNNGSALLVDANPAAGLIYGLQIDADQSAANNSTIYGLYNTTNSSAASAGLIGDYTIARKDAGTGTIYGAYDYAQHLGTGGTTYGTYSYAYGSDSGTAYGEYGYAYKPSTDTGGTAYGGYFTGDNDYSAGNSYGVYSRAIGSGGTNYGIYAAASSGTTNYAGFFVGDLIVDSGNTSALAFRLEPAGYSSNPEFAMYDVDNELKVRIVARETATTEGAEIKLYDEDGTNTIELDAEFASDGGGYLALRNGDGSTTISLDSDFGGDGRITTDEIQITGGSDLSEQFDVNPIQTEVKPGMVVSIDPDQMGRLQVSTDAYDKKVAGIISGANGVKPGMMMGQKETAADGAYPVALTGRVYCLADAANGPIEPGDLLTTSEVPGHAMRVSDYPRAQGAILGKAMSRLDSGQGMVLVLVTLQ